MNKIGVVFGGYCPMTRGHMEVIMRAKKECEKLVIIVCGSNNEKRANEIGLSLQKRWEIIHKIFKFDSINNHYVDNNDIYVTYINDDDIGLKEQDMLSLHNWTIWLDCAFNKIKHKFSEYNYDVEKEDITFYVGEKLYYDVLTNNFNYKCVLIDRNEIPISGTMIRYNPVKYWNYIVKEFRPAMCKKILVIGTASEGKSTLVDDISRYFNLSMIDERGRAIMDKYRRNYNPNFDDKCLNYYHFNSFVTEQYEYICNAINNTSEPFIISDTDNLITLMYATAYAERDDMPNISKSDVEKLKTDIEYYINKIKWDKIYVLTPNNTFVDDGSRFMGQASLEERTKNFNILKELINKYYDYADIEYLTGGEYLNNFNTIKTYINEYYN